MIYDLDTVLQNPKAVTTIYFPSTGMPDLEGKLQYPPPIYALIETDFSTDIQAHYSAVDEGQVAAAQGVANGIIGATGGANRVIRNIQQTVQRWSGHSSPSFTVPIIVVRYKQSQLLGVSDTVRYLTSAPAGTYENISLRAPFGYGFNGLGSTLPNYIQGIGAGVTQINDSIGQNNTVGAVPTSLSTISSFVYGTWTLRIGDWFVASDLILQHVSVTVSKESVKGTNEPLYARCNCTFTTAYLPDARQIAAWFLQTVPDTGYYQVSNTVAGNNGNKNAPL